MNGLRARPTRPPRAERDRPRLDLDPATTYEVLTRRMVEDLAREVTALRGRVDAIFWVVVGSVVADLLLRLAP